MPNSKSYKYDRYAGCSDGSLSNGEQAEYAAIVQKAESDKAQEIYAPFYNKAEPMVGENLTLYRFSWKQYGYGTLSVKQGVTNRRSQFGY